jgi:GT2 family glycosyltransferase
MPRVQVLLATYNGRAYLPELLDSVFGQRGVDVEVLARDDGSDDGTWDLLADYASRRQLVAHAGTHRNPGVSRAYLEGARVAAERGKRWLLLLDQDTCFPSEAITVYADALRRYPTEVLFAPVLRAGARIVSPCAYRFPRGRPRGRPRPASRTLRGNRCSTAGCAFRWRRIWTWEATTRVSDSISRITSSPTGSSGGMSTRASCPWSANMGSRES